MSLRVKALSFVLLLFRGSEEGIEIRQPALHTLDQGLIVAHQIEVNVSEHLRSQLLVRLCETGEIRTQCFG